MTVARVTNRAWLFQTRALLLALLLVASMLSAALGWEANPKFGPNAVPITARTDFLRTSPAADYWKLSPFYISQMTSNACSVASAAMAINFVRGLPSGAEQPLVTQAFLLAKVGDAGWSDQVAETGTGVTFAELVSAVNKSLAAYGFRDYRVEIIRPVSEGPETLATLRQALALNEASADDIMLVYFNQGVLTGDWDGPHISPVGAYDAEAALVLIMDVDRDWYVPYWTGDTKLLEAMLRPAPAAHGRLAGETGGLLWMRPKSVD